jgi:hypothetical protein
MIVEAGVFLKKRTGKTEKSEGCCFVERILMSLHLSTVIFHK